MNEYIWLVFGIIFLAMAVWFSTPPVTVNGLQAIPTVTKYTSDTRDELEVDGVIKAKDSHGQVLARLTVNDNDIFADPGELRIGFGAEHIDGPITFEYERRFYLREYNFYDLGTFASFYPSQGDDASRFQVGLRYAPGRFLFHTIAAPDFAISKEIAGVGLSFYPPPRYFPKLRNFGVGAWYCAPFDGGNPRWMYGLSFSVR